MADHPSDLRTPLGRVRFLGSARTGTTDAWLVHLTSVALVPAHRRLRLARARPVAQGLQRRARRSSRARFRQSCCWRSSSPASSIWSLACAPSSSTISTASRARGRWPPTLFSPRFWRSHASMRRCASPSPEQPLERRTIDGDQRLFRAERAGARGQGLSDHRPHVRCHRGRRRRRRLARERRLRPSRPAHGVHLESVPDPLAYGRRARRHFRLPRQHGCRRLAVAHVRHRQGLRLARRPGRDRIHVPPGAGRGL